MQRPDFIHMPMPGLKETEFVPNNETSKQAPLSPTRVKPDFVGEERSIRTSRDAENRGVKF